MLVLFTSYSYIQFGIFFFYVQKHAQTFQNFDYQLIVFNIFTRNVYFQGVCIFLLFII